MTDTPIDNVRERVSRMEMVIENYRGMCERNEKGIADLKTAYFSNKDTITDQINQIDKRFIKMENQIEDNAERQTRHEDSHKKINKIGYAILLAVLGIIVERIFERVLL